MTVQLVPMSATVIQSKALVWTTTAEGASSSPSASTGMSEARAAKGIGVIVAVFVVSWLPLYTINTMLFLCPDCHVPCQLIDICIVLSHFNSAWNPALYAWGVRDLRAALRQLVCCKNGNGGEEIVGTF